MEKIKHSPAGKRKADVTISQIVTWTLLIVGFVILLLVFFYAINWGGEIDKSVCHESTIFRATLPGVTKGYLPLKCQTQKICITDNLLFRGDCKEFEGSKGVVTIRVDDALDISKVYADEMVGCWSMMGEGKVSLWYDGAQTFGFQKIYPSCVICSRIAFDKDIKIDLTEVDVQGYMAKYKMPESDLTYLQYFAKEQGKLTIPDNLNFKSVRVAENKIDAVPGGDSGELNKLPDTSLLPKEDNGESAVLFMQIQAPHPWTSLRNTLGLTAAGVFITGTGKPILKICSAVGWWPCAIAAIFAVGHQQLAVAENRYISAGFCGDVSVGSEARSGCSVVKTVNYDLSAIQKTCTNIESLV